MSPMSKPDAGPEAANTPSSPAPATADVAATRYFLSYAGVGLPLRLVQELDASDLRHRNTYFRAEYDAKGRPLSIAKLVYGEVELAHDYRWSDEGRLVEATVRQGDDEPVSRLL